jgi:uncharacterized membrane protein YoaK (UPF0700 family)
MASENDSPVATQLRAALLLAGTGGLLDAIVYLNHGHVFANAMTGNVIFLAMAVTRADWAQAVRHVVPLLAFLAGVLAARWLAEAPGRQGSLIPLSLEVVTLAVLGALPASFPELAFTGIVGFASAFQVTAFRRIGRFSYNSTFVTGNMREIGEGLYDLLRSRDPAKRHVGGRKSVKLGLICLGFFGGALVGSWLAVHHPRHAIWAAEPLLVAVLVLVLRQTGRFAAGSS